MEITNEQNQKLIDLFSEGLGPCGKVTRMLSYKVGLGPFNLGTAKIIKKGNLFIIDRTKSEGIFNKKNDYKRVKKFRSFDMKITKILQN